MGHELLQGRIRKGKAGMAYMLTMRQWLAVCMLAGSVLEALFYLALQSNGERRRKERFMRARNRAAKVYKGTVAQRKYLHTFHLPDFAQTAEQMGLIGVGAVDAVCAVHNYRCFLHANKVHKEAMDCTESMALFASATVHLVERELQANRSVLDAPPAPVATGQTGDAPPARPKTKSASAAKLMRQTLRQLFSMPLLENPRPLIVRYM